VCSCGELHLPEQACRPACPLARELKLHLAPQQLCAPTDTYCVAAHICSSHPPFDLQGDAEPALSKVQLLSDWLKTVLQNMKILSQVSKFVWQGHMQACMHEVRQSPRCLTCSRLTLTLSLFFIRTLLPHNCPRTCLAYPC